ncbi:MAG: hypothetical protein LUH14_08755 [Clostridiaceae bacterium]|nr:hypothetical protein [Clostridiaceae bacterium]
MAFLPGVFQATKKNGTKYYRSSITYRSRHISLGSYPTEQLAHQAYLEAKTLLECRQNYLPDNYNKEAFPQLSFSKWISLINFKNNGYYIKTPIYLWRNFFSYYLSPTDILLFDADDLFYYSKHSIMRRGNHLFVAEYGMQTNIRSRYGIKNFARPGIDFRFVNGDSNDFRYSNIEIINPYHGVTCTRTETAEPVYTAKIHVNGDYIIGKYRSAKEAAIAYNKAVDLLKEKGCKKNFEKNYLEHLNSQEYHAIYQSLPISEKLKQSRLFHR